jgi:hypothetical protein
MATGALTRPARVRPSAQLTTPRMRRRLAGALDHVLESATLPASQQARAVVIPCRASVRATAGQMEALARRLRSDAPIAAAGVVRLEALLCDGTGPVYAPGHADVLASTLAMAARWLDVEG